MDVRVRLHLQVLLGRGLLPRSEHGVRAGLGHPAWSLCSRHDVRLWLWGQELLTLLVGGWGIALLVAYRRQEVVYDVVLPVAHLTVAFHLCLRVLNVIDVESCVVLKVAESHLIEFLSKREELIRRNVWSVASLVLGRDVPALLSHSWWRVAIVGPLRRCWVSKHLNELRRVRFILFDVCELLWIYQVIEWILLRIDYVSMHRRALRLCLRGKYRFHLPQPYLLLLLAFTNHHLQLLICFLIGWVVAVSSAAGFASLFKRVPTATAPRHLFLQVKLSLKQLDLRLQVSDRVHE